MKIDIYSDNISYVTNEVSSVKAYEANLNEENRIKFVTDLAAVSRGKSESKNPSARYRALLKEAAPSINSFENVLNDKNNRGLSMEDIKSKITGSPSRPLEFLPVVLKYFIAGNNYNLCDTNYSKAEVSRIIVSMSSEQFNNSLGQHSYLEQGKVYTNMRAVLNAGIPYEKVPYNSIEDLGLFIALKANIPMFVWAQVPNTHCAISKEAQSDRVAENNNYWLPKDFRDKVYEYKQKHDFEFKDSVAQELLEKDNKQLIGTYPKLIYRKLVDAILGCQTKEQIPYIMVYGNEATECIASQGIIQEFFKELGYLREIYSRAMYYFKYKEVVMTGWYRDPKVWRHLFIERNANLDIWKNWTQEQTKQFVKSIRYIVEGESDD